MMKTKHFVTAFLVIAANFLQAMATQPGDDDLIDAPDFFTEENANGSPDYVYGPVELPPQYPGGDQALLEFLCSNLRYPKPADGVDVHGQVVVRFVVKKDGSVGDVEIVRSLAPEYDDEVVRVVKLLKGFSPGQMQGKPVNVWYILPVTFRS